MKSAIDSSDREFLDQMHRIGPGTVQEICARLGVTATAVRQRLGRLQNLDLVSRQTVRSGRGRPHHAYELTTAGRRELGENYSDLARILWSELKKIANPEVRKQVLGSVRDALVQHYGSGIHGATVTDRLRGLCDSLSNLGFDVELVEARPGEAVEGEANSPDSPAGSDGVRLPILRENNCPYFELASSDSSICELEQEVFRQILGTAVTLTQCCLSGGNCCEFEALNRPLIAIQ